MPTARRRIVARSLDDEDGAPAVAVGAAAEAEAEAVVAFSSKPMHIRQPLKPTTPVNSSRRRWLAASRTWKRSLVGSLRTRSLIFRSVLSARERSGSSFFWMTC